MSALAFRPTGPAEEGVLSELCRASVLAIQKDQPEHLIRHWAAMLTPERLRIIRKGHWTVVAEQDGVPVGFASLDGDVLGMLYVHPDHQGGGIARALVREVAAEALRQGIRLLRVDASMNAVSAYRHWGFVDHGVREKTDTAGVTYRVHRMHALVARLLR